MAFPRNEQAVNDLIGEFEVNLHVPRLDWIGPILTATNPDLTAFRDCIGKPLIYFGRADQSLNGRMGINYYESTVKKMGPSTASFFALFMQPGVFHCGGAVGPGSFEPLPILVDLGGEGKNLGQRCRCRKLPLRRAPPAP